MPEVEKLYDILEEMVASTVKRDSKKILELDLVYTELAQKVYGFDSTPLQNEYDNCRIACVVSVTMPWSSEECRSDAQQRFSKIPKPRK